MKLEERLGANKYYVDETSPHILVDGAGFSHEEKMKLVKWLPCWSIYITRKWRFSL